MPLVLLSVATCGLAYYFLRCRHVNAKRHPMGGFKCPDCGHASGTLPTLGGEGHVEKLRAAGL